MSSPDRRCRRFRPLPVVVVTVLACTTPSSTLPPDTGDGGGNGGGGDGSGTVLFQENFEDGALASRGWYDLPAGGITSFSTAEHAPGSTRSLEISFAAGARRPSPSVGARHAFTASDAVFLTYWVKYSSNWVGSGRSYHPHEFHFITNQDDDYVGPASTHLTVNVEHNFQADGGHAVLAIQDSRNIDVSRIGQDLTNVTEDRAVAGCNGTLDDTAGDCYQSGSNWFNGKLWRSAAPAFTHGEKSSWHKVQAYFKLNSIANGRGVPDGLAQYWVDGELLVDRRNVLFRTAVHEAMRFDQFILSPYIGDGSPVAQTMWLDDIVLTTAP